MCLIVFCNAVFSQSTSKICTLIRFTLFSNESDIVKTLSVVLLPYRFTLFSNVCHKRNSHERVLLPYRFTLFSNRRLPFHQTLYHCHRLNALFYYLIDLHYSQTGEPPDLSAHTFYYLIDLHYSQTSVQFIQCLASFTTL